MLASNRNLMPRQLFRLAWALQTQKHEKTSACKLLALQPQPIKWFFYIAVK